MCRASSGQGTFCEWNWGLEKFKIAGTITVSLAEKLFLNGLARNDPQEMTYKKWPHIFLLKFSNPVNFIYSIFESPFTSFEPAVQYHILGMYRKLHHRRDTSFIIGLLIIFCKSALSPRTPLSLQKRSNHHGPSSMPVCSSNPDTQIFGL